MIGTRIASATPLIGHADLLRELPASDRVEEFVRESRRQINRVLAGGDDRLLVIAGPCSIHNVDEAVEYARILRNIADTYRADVLVAMRVYLEKPRTTVGWRGLVNDPHLDSSFDVNAGLRAGRGLLLKVAETGLPAATEFLDTALCQYYADLVSWGAIGARTVESQVHRELASAMPMPVGFKNRTDGNVQVAVDAIVAARHPHGILAGWGSGAAVLRTTGNQNCHVVLRGGTTPNYWIRDIASAIDACEAAGALPRVIVDCSHANSGKRAENQPRVASYLAHLIAAGRREVAGVMLESNIVAGAQKPSAKLTPGVSITDECIDVSTTAQVIAELAAAVRAKRKTLP